ncbi:MAG TPA: hypothetical protein DDY43_12950 [Synechococcales bacterium UBA10510]|nr:hypothetical protein [Synechococcales bacterium UBA10510]
MSPSQATPRSRIYWEIKADQVLNDVFNQAAQASAYQASAHQHSIERAIEVEVLEPAALKAARPPAHWQASPSQLLVFAGIGLAGLLVAGIGLGLWSQSLQTLRQEQNLLLLERLRNFGPAGSAQVSDAAVPKAEPGPVVGQATSAELPPPPNEPWMQQLASLPGGQAAAVQPLPATVRANDQISRPAPAVTLLPPAAAIRPAGGSISSTPLLMGVVQAPGHGATAIFQIGGSSSTAAVGELIGDTSWRLRSASSDSVLIERGGQQRQLSLSGDS